jgi:uncharacterized membrane protein
VKGFDRGGGGGGGRGPIGPFGPRGFEHHGGPEVWQHLLGLLIVAAIVALIAFLLLRLYRRWQPATGAVAGPSATAIGAMDPALSEVRLRYARGEVSRDDFLRISADLTGTPLAGTGAPPPSPTAPPPPPSSTTQPETPATPPAGSPPAGPAPAGPPPSE